jgi:hypothetical protein
MTDYEFILFRQFYQEMIPALARQVDVSLKPKFNLDDREAVHLPMGNVKRLDRQLRDDAEYASFRMADYM